MQNFLQGKIKLLILTVVLSVVSQWGFAGHFIDGSLKNRQVLEKSFEHTSDKVLHFLSHGREGQLLVEGRWLTSTDLVPVFTSYLKDHPGTNHINIYGCEFAKGEKGKSAVAYLQQQLGVSIAASENITGKKGDWKLEVGKSVDAVRVVNYGYNLQYAPDDDFDEDGIINSLDLDDDNDGVLDTEECSDLGYTNYFGYKDDLMTAYCHGVIAQTTDGFIAWGNVAKPGTGTIGGAPVRITPANGYAYTGTILLATGGNHNQGAGNQTFLLTTTGLFVFGSEGAVIENSLTSSTAVQSINLPSGVSVTDIKKITATYGAFALLTKDGKAYVLGTSHYVYGDGSAAANSGWHLVDIAATLVNIKVASVGRVAFAQDSEGKLYTWGSAAYLGNGTIPSQQLTPVEMASLPGGVLPAQIALGSSYQTAAYYALGRDGKVYSVGTNENGQMGDGSLVARTSWGTVQTSSGNDLTNIVFINANDNSSAPAVNSSASAINNSGVLYSWGYNASYTIGFPGAADQVYAGIPTNISGKVVRYVENGYHITPVIDSNGGICNVGHNAEGAFGDGTTQNRDTYQCNSLLGGPYTLSAGLADACDLDGDGVPNQFDLDSDGDGCPDSQEAGVVKAFPAVQFADINVTNEEGVFYAEKSKLAAATFVDVNGNGFDDRLESVTAGVYSGTYTYSLALDPNYKNCVVITQAVNDVNQTPLNKPVTGNVLTNDVDPQGDAQTVTSVTGLDVSGNPIAIPLTNTPTPIYDKDHNLAGTLAISSTGVYTFVPQTGYTGAVPVSYTIVDAKGATDGAELIIKVLPELSPVQNPPVATNDVNKVRAGSTVSNKVLANDHDIDGDAITVTAATGRSATGTPITLTSTPVAIYDENNVLAGMASINASGIISFTADINFTGIVPVNYTISDGTATDTAVLTITVDPADANNTVYANDDTGLGRKNVTQTGNVLTNDYDPEEDTQTVTGGRTSTGTAIVTGVPVNLPSGGQLTLTTTGTYTYIPDADFVGTEVVTYTTCDDGVPQACQTATLYLTTLINDATLPVTLLSFTGRNSVEGIVLSWQTANEFDFDRFVIEKSINSVKNFKEVGVAEGGNSSYTFTDRAGSKGVNYYRLKMINKDGSSATSRIISVYLEYGAGEHIVFPNPAVDRSFFIHNYFKLETFNVFNSSGKEVKVKLAEVAGDYKFTLDKSTPSGIYFLEYQFDGQVIRRKVVVD